MIILALESSSTASKAMLFDTEKGVLKVEVCPFPSQIDDIISQDTEGVYQELLKLARRICASQQVDSIALGGTWHNLSVCDKAMKPVTRTHSWLDTSAAAVVSRLREDAALTSYYYNNCGCMIHTTYAPFKLKHMREQGLDLSDKLVIDQGSYNFFRLSGKRLTTKSMASGMGFLNIHSLSYEPEALKIAGISEDQLNPLGRDYGQLTEAAAREIGLPQGTPIMPAFPDGALNQMGANAMKPGIMTLSVGTSAAMRLIAQKPLVSECQSTWCYVSVMDTWLSGAATAGACNCIDWVKKQLLKDQYSYAELEDNSINKESLPIFLPFIYGERCPGWNDSRRGGYLEINASHQPADFFISAMEGVLFNIKQCYDILPKPDKIMVSGGILKSAMWSQMLSDILGEEVYRTDMEQCSLMGAAFVAAKTLGAATNMELCSQEKLSPNQADFDMHFRRYKRYLALLK